MKHITLKEPSVNCPECKGELRVFNWLTLFGIRYVVKTCSNCNVRYKWRV